MIHKIAAILDKRAFMIWPWENPKSEHFGKDYVTGYSTRQSIEKRRRAARRKAVLILELLRPETLPDSADNQN